MKMVTCLITEEPIAKFQNMRTINKNVRFTSLKSALFLSF